MTAGPADPLARWSGAALSRHAGGLTTTEFLRAVRALSARYVERRASLPDRSPLDSPGKRAAFAGFFAPIHAYTIRAIAARLAPSPLTGIDTIVDLGCGTGAAGAALASLRPAGTVTLSDVDQQGWALGEATWTRRTLGVPGRSRREDLVAASARLLRQPAAALARTLVVLAWSANELATDARRQLLGTLVACTGRGGHVLVIEPIGSGATPWWPRWAAALGPPRGREDAWTLDLDLPPELAALHAQAGFARGPAKAKSLFAPC